MSKVPNSKPNKNKKKSIDQSIYQEEETKQAKNYKTELCKTFSETNHCPYGKKCRFAHGKAELFVKIVTHPKYKRSDCLSFHQNFYCNYGTRCHFRHDERKLENIERSYYSYLLEIYGSNIKKKNSRLGVFQELTKNKPENLLNKKCLEGRERMLISAHMF